MTTKILAKTSFLKMIDENGWNYVKCCKPHISLIVPLLKTDNSSNRYFIFVEQYRTPVHSFVIEFPSGHVEPNEKPSDAALRELTEETGYKASNLIKLNKGPVSAGLSDEMIHLFLATDLKKVKISKNNNEEKIIVHKIPYCKIYEWLESQKKEGKLIDLKIYTGLFLYNLSC